MIFIAVVIAASAVAIASAAASGNSPVKLKKPLVDAIFSIGWELVVEKTAIVHCCNAAVTKASPNIVVIRLATGQVLMETKISNPTVVQITSACDQFQISHSPSNIVRIICGNIEYMPEPTENEMAGTMDLACGRCNTADTGISKEMMDALVGAKILNIQFPKFKSRQAVLATLYQNGKAVFRKESQLFVAELDQTCPECSALIIREVDVSTASAELQKFPSVAQLDEMRALSSTVGEYPADACLIRRSEHSVKITLDSGLSVEWNENDYCCDCKRAHYSYNITINGWAVTIDQHTKDAICKTSHSCSNSSCTHDAIVVDNISKRTLLALFAHFPSSVSVWRSHLSPGEVPCVLLRTRHVEWMQFKDYLAICIPQIPLSCCNQPDLWVVTASSFAATFADLSAFRKDLEGFKVFPIAPGIDLEWYPVPGQFQIVFASNNNSFIIDADDIARVVSIIGPNNS